MHDTHPLHKVRTLASTLLALSALHTAPALAGADLSVTGRIQPGACSLALSNGGAIDLGTISRKDLKASDKTRFLRDDVTLAIDCQTPTKVAIKAINNRENVVDRGEPAYGLGPTGSKSQSLFSFTPGNRFGDGKPLRHLYRRDGSQSSWTASSDSGFQMGPSSLSAWAEEGETRPQAFRSIRSKLYFFIVLPALRDLDLSQEIDLDGSATLELVYL